MRGWETRGGLRLHTQEVIMAIRRVDDLAQLDRYCHRDSYELYRFQFARYVVFSSASGIRADPHSAADLYSRSRSAHARDVDVRFSHARSEEHTSELQSPTNLVCRV